MNWIAHKLLGTVNRKKKVTIKFVWNFESCSWGYILTKMVFHRANSAGSLQHPVETPATQCGAGSQWEPAGVCGQHPLKFQGQWWEDCAECYHSDNRLVCQSASHCMVIWKMLLHKLFDLGSALAKMEW